MKENTYDIDDLIGKYLSGEALPEESSIVENWVRANEANARYFDQLKFVFHRASTVKDIPQFNTDQAWLKLKSRIQYPREGKVVTMRPFWDNLYVKIAATVIIVLGVGFFTYKTFQPGTSKPLEIVAEQKILTDTLPGGSAVTLNKASQIAYAYNKSKRLHSVKLKGEAYFEVEHEKDEKFIVETDVVLIEDIGTSFNVKAYAETNTIEVVVEEGEVHLFTATDQGIFVRAGGKGIYDKQTKKFFVDQPEPNVSAYKTKHFVFSDTELSSIVAVVNQVYDKKIVIAPHLANCRLTVTFNDESVDEIANVIAETLGLSVTSQSSNLLLEGKACEN